MGGLGAGLLGFVAGTAGSYADRAKSEEEAMREQNMMRFKSKLLREENDRQYDRKRTDTISDRGYRDSREDAARIEDMQTALDAEARKLANAKDLYSYQQNNKAASELKVGRYRPDDMGRMYDTATGSYGDERQATSVSAEAQARIRASMNGLATDGPADTTKPKVSAPAAPNAGLMKKAAAPSEQRARKPRSVAEKVAGRNLDRPDKATLQAARRVLKDSGSLFSSRWKSGVSPEYIKGISGQEMAALQDAVDLGILTDAEDTQAKKIIAQYGK